jgi:hypothetical protein
METGGEVSADGHREPVRLAVLDGRAEMCAERYLDRPARFVGDAQRLIMLGASSE